ncbi:MAG: ABC transporter ATP-binding protein [Halobacteriota archaeon]|nr:ABC transporter ATP-binding protein [Halobacteriota archaeon]
MIKVENLVKIYKMGEVEVVGASNINLQVQEGEFLSIMGPSGSGKSTLLHLLGGLDKPTSGRVYIDDVDISKLSYSELCNIRRDKIGFIFQSFNLLPTLNVIENVFVPLAPTGISDEKREYAKELIELVGLGDRIHHTPNKLSGGEQQRVAIARAFINNPDIILADEPTGNLDSKSGREVMQLMKNMNKNEGVTLVIVTHDPNVGNDTDRTIYIRDGEILMDLDNTIPQADPAPLNPLPSSEGLLMTIPQ